MQRLPAPTSDPHLALRARFARHGALCWRISESVVVLDCDDLAMPGANLLQGSVIVGSLRRLADEQRAKADPTPRTILPGCEVVFVPVRERRVVTAWTAMMFLGPALFESPGFAEACDRAQIDPTAAEKVLRPFARFSPDEVARMANLASLMGSDLEDASRTATTLDGFSQTLADAYEHIELMHAMAQGMRSLEDPTRFVHDALEGILGATPFGWVAMSLRDCPWRRDGEDRMLLRSGSPPATEPALLQFAASVLQEQTEHAGARILSDERVRDLVGARDQIVVLPIERQGRRVGLLMAGGKSGFDSQVSTYDTRVIDAAGAFAGTFFENVTLILEQQATFVGALKAVTSAVDAKDSYTRGHSERVAHLAARLARLIGMDDPAVERVHMAGLVHDVGKIGVPESVLCKAGRLTDEEFMQIKQHPRIGHDILEGIPQLSDILPGVLWHHERWDGRGYPDGLEGEAIPLVARLIALADTFDAMSSNRSYRAAMPREQILAEVRKCAGTQFDPELAPRFVTLDFSEYDRLVADHRPQRVVEDRAA